MRRIPAGDPCPTRARCRPGRRSKIRPPAPPSSTTAPDAPDTVWSAGHQLAIRVVHISKACSGGHGNLERDRDRRRSLGACAAVFSATAGSGPPPRPRHAQDSPGRPAARHLRGGRSVGCRRRARRQARILEQLEMAGHRRPADRQRGRDLVHGLVAVTQQPQDLTARCRHRSPRTDHRRDGPRPSSRRCSRLRDDRCGLGNHSATVTRRLPIEQAGPTRPALAPLAQVVPPMSSRDRRIRVDMSACLRSGDSATSSPPCRGRQTHRAPPWPPLACASVRAHRTARAGFTRTASKGRS